MEKNILNEINLIKKRMGLITESIVTDWVKDVIKNVSIGFPSLLTHEDEILMKSYLEGTINSADQKLVDEIFKTQKGQILSRYMDDMVKSLERQKASGGLTPTEIREIETAISRINSKKTDLDSLISLHSPSPNQGGNQNPQQFDLLSMRQKVLKDVDVARKWSKLDSQTQSQVDNFMRLHFGNKTESQIIKDAQKWIKEEYSNIENSALSAEQKAERKQMLKDFRSELANNPGKYLKFFIYALLGIGAYKIAAKIGIVPEISLPSFKSDNIPPPPTDNGNNSGDGNGQGW